MTTLEDEIWEKERLRIELERAYRAIRGFYTAYKGKTIPDPTMMAYHASTIGAALRFVKDGSLDGANYFTGKHIDVLADVLKDDK